MRKRRRLPKSVSSCIARIYESLRLKGLEHLRYNFRSTSTVIRASVMFHKLAIPADTKAQTDGRRWLKHVARLNLLLGLTYAAVFIFFAFRARFTVPYGDDWPWLTSLQDAPFTKALWQTHNEHIIVIPRLLLWLDFFLWGWPGYATLFAALLSHATIAGVLALYSVADRSRQEALLLIGSVLVLTFLTYALQGAVFPGSVLFPLVAAFSTSSIACL